jgi:hypothetical protein
VNKLRGEKDIETTLQRLDRLTLDETRATAAQTLEVVYGLVRNKRVDMGGEKFYLSRSLLAAERLYVEGNESAASISGALGMFRVGQKQETDTTFIWAIESIQDIVIKMNKAERGLCSISGVLIDG